MFEGVYFLTGLCEYIIITEGVDNGLLIILVPKFYNNVFYSWLNNFKDFSILIHLVECPNVSTTNCNLQKG